MIALSSTCLAIACAIRDETLTVSEHDGRFGPYWAISDDHGLIEVALTADEAQERITEIERRIAA